MIVIKPMTIRKILYHIINFLFTAPLPNLATPITSKPTMRRKINVSVEKEGLSNVNKKMVIAKNIKIMPDRNFIVFQYYSILY